MKSLIRMAVLGLVLVTVLLTSTVTASAQGTATDSRTLFLTSTPNSSNVACTSRSIFIAANTYTWDLFFDSIDFGSRSIFLRTDTYTWEDCIFGQNDGGYTTSSFLVNSSGGVAELDSIFEVFLSASGTHTFGSTLSS